eukprot:scaffold40195_cov24-Prasinocladus_malaysianus.AAC.1
MSQRRLRRNMIALAGAGQGAACAAHPGGGDRVSAGAGQPLGGHKRLAVGGACHCHAGPVGDFVELHLSCLTWILRKCCYSLCVDFLTSPRLRPTANL